MTIAKICKKCGMTADTLWYYERVGLISRVFRISGGARDYDEESCGWIELMKCMCKAGVEIKTLVEYVALSKQGDGTIDARGEALIKQHRHLGEHMADVQKSLDTLDLKIREYEQGLIKEEQLLRGGHNGKNYET